MSEQMKPQLRDTKPDYVGLFLEGAERGIERGMAWQFAPEVLVEVVHEIYHLRDVEARAKVQLELYKAQDDAEVSASYATADFILNGENCDAAQR